MREIVSERIHDWEGCFKQYEDFDTFPVESKEEIGAAQLYYCI